MPDTKTYTPHRPIMWFVRDESTRSHPPSLLLHVEQGDYFGTLATVLNFVREGMMNDFPNPKNSTMPQEKSLHLLEGMRDDLVYLQNNYDLVKKEE